MHFTALAPCIDSPEAPDCVEFADEIKDIQAYHNLLSTSWGSPSASAVMVGFHNLVTASITGNPRTQKYLAPDRRRLYCVADVLQALPADYVSDVNVPAAPPAYPGVPGLAAQHRLLSCPA